MEGFMDCETHSLASCVFETAKGVNSQLVTLLVDLENVHILINTLVGGTHWALVSISVVSTHKNTEEQE